MILKAIVFSKHNKSLDSKRKTSAKTIRQIRKKTTTIFLKLLLEN